MHLDVQFHQALQKVNGLERPTQWCANQARNHPDFYKGVLVINHLFRAVSIWAFLKYCQSPMKIKLAICFGGSLIYRLTVESNCAYKFALPAFFGGAALLTASRSAAKIMNRSALRTFKSLGHASLNMVPIAGYLVYITLTASYDVDNPKNRCH